MQPAAEAPTVFLVEDDPQVQETLAACLTMAGMAVSSFESAEAFLKVHTVNMRGCLVVDVMLPRMDGVGLIAALNTKATRLPAIAMSGHARTSVVVESMRAGAVDFLEKPFTPTDLLGAVGVAMSWASTGASEMRGDAAAAAARVATLTPRERSVFDQFATGASTKQVAAVLALSPKTVEAYRTRLLNKLNVPTPYALVRLAVLAALFGPAASDRTSDPPL